MSKAKKLLELIKHSQTFVCILEQASPETVIRTITHSAPLLVFWVTPSGDILDAKNAHFQNPPNGDRSILSDATNKGHLRGRAARIGDKIYIDIYGDEKDHTLSKRQFALLRRAFPRLLSELVTRGNTDAADANFITEDGQDILI